MKIIPGRSWAGTPPVFFWYLAEGQSDSSPILEGEKYQQLTVTFQSPTGTILHLYNAGETENAPIVAIKYETLPGREIDRDGNVASDQQCRLSRIFTVRGSQEHWCARVVRGKCVEGYEDYEVDYTLKVYNKKTQKVALISDTLEGVIKPMSSMQFDVVP